MRALSWSLFRHSNAFINQTLLCCIQSVAWSSHILKISLPSKSDIKLCLKDSMYFELFKLSPILTYFLKPSLPMCLQSVRLLLTTFTVFDVHRDQFCFSGRLLTNSCLLERETSHISRRKHCKLVLRLKIGVGLYFVCVTQGFGKRDWYDKYQTLKVKSNCQCRLLQQKIWQQNASRSRNKRNEISKRQKIQRHVFRGLCTGCVISKRNMAENLQ